MKEVRVYTEVFDDVIKYACDFQDTHTLVLFVLVIQCMNSCES